MGISEDWADSVRARRFVRWERRGGPAAASRWAFENPRGAFLVAVAIGVVAGVVAALVAGNWWLGVGLFTIVMGQHELLRGERTVYNEWRNVRQDDTG